MSTYFVFYTKHGVNDDADMTILVDSDCSGEALYDDVMKAIRRFWVRIAGNRVMLEFTVKNIVCLGGAPGMQMPEENPLRVTHSSRPDLEISLDIGGTYNDRMDVNVTDKATGETHSMCFELPADPRRL